MDAANQATAIHYCYLSMDLLHTMKVNVTKCPF